MTETESESDDIERIAPHAEAGFTPVDVLKQAQKGDRIYLEMDFYDAPFEFVRGSVVNVIENPDDDDGRMIRKTIQVEGSGDIEMVNLGLTRYERKRTPSGVGVSDSTARQTTALHSAATPVF